MPGVCSRHVTSPHRRYRRVGDLAVTRLRVRGRSRSDGRQFAGQDRGRHDRTFTQVGKLLAVVTLAICVLVFPGDWSVRPGVDRDSFVSPVTTVQWTIAAPAARRPPSVRVNLISCVVRGRLGMAAWRSIRWVTRCVPPVSAHFAHDVAAAAPASSDLRSHRMGKVATGEGHSLLRTCRHIDRYGRREGAELHHHTVVSASEVRNGPSRPRKTRRPDNEVGSSQSAG
jgi:hypothetical protein